MSADPLEKIARKAKKNQIKNPLNKLEPVDDINKDYKIEDGAIIPKPTDDKVFKKTALELAEIKRKKGLEEEKEAKEALKQVDENEYDIVAAFDGKGSKAKKGKKKDEKEIEKKQGQTPSKPAAPQTKGALQPAQGKPQATAQSKAGSVTSVRGNVQVRLANRAMQY